jgi:hypothetical protein
LKKTSGGGGRPESKVWDLRPQLRLSYVSSGPRAVGEAGAMYAYVRDIMTTGARDLGPGIYGRNALAAPDGARS